MVVLFQSLQHVGPGLLWIHQQVSLVPVVSMSDSLRRNSAEHRQSPEEIATNFNCGAMRLQDVRCRWTAARSLSEKLAAFPFIGPCW